MDGFEEKVVLSSLIHKPELLVDEKFPIKTADFSKKTSKQIYNAVYNLYVLGATEVNASEIEAQISKVPSAYKDFKEHNGPRLLIELDNMDSSAYTFEVYFNNLKKKSLIRELIKQGIDTTDILDYSKGEKELEEQIKKFEQMSYKDIIDNYKEKLAKVEDKYENLIEKSGIEAGEGIKELLLSFEEQEEMGLPLNGDLLNTATRGARRKKVYLNSASSGQGKTRLAAGNAAKLAFPYYYDNDKGKWVDTGMKFNVLFVTTELEHSEIQTMFLAYISGVNEEKILTNRYDSQEEKARVMKAADIIEQSDNIYIEFIPDPSIESVSAKIRVYALQKEIEYVFYDYIHVSSSTYRGKKDMRDDVWLMLFVDRLKQLANELNIFVFTATQVNASAYEDREIKNESMIRGAKSIADKCDVAMITSAILKEQEKGLAKSLSLKMGTKTPNQIIDIYKNRRGKWRNVRIWRYTDLGTCRSYDCFATDTGNNPIDMKGTKIATQQLVKEGAFPIIDSDTGEIVSENRKVTEIYDL